MIGETHVISFDGLSRSQCLQSHYLYETEWKRAVEQVMGGFLQVCQGL